MPIKFTLTDKSSLILLTVRFKGKFDRQVECVLALDTGASQTTLRPELLKAAGFASKDAVRKVSLTTVSKTEIGYEYFVNEFEAIDQISPQLLVIAKKLPETLPFDGLLGLDFFRILRKQLLIDFDLKEIEIRD